MGKIPVKGTIEWLEFQERLETDLQRPLKRSEVKWLIKLSNRQHRIERAARSGTSKLNANTLPHRGKPTGKVNRFIRTGKVYAMPKSDGRQD